jgi:dTDP-glucose 4,6-dehydratase
MQATILITGGVGFIGSNVVLQRMHEDAASIINLDDLTYASNLRNLESIANDRRYSFVHGDIGNRELLKQLLERTRRARSFTSPPKAT